MTAHKRRSQSQIAAAKQKSEKAHATRIEATYGITGIQYWKLWNYQGGKCAICMRATGRSRRLAVDHNHTLQPDCDHPSGPLGCAECVRGLLCSTCNKFIGWNRDDPEVGIRMSRYLTDPPWPHLRKSLTS